MQLLVVLLLALLPRNLRQEAEVMQHLANLVPAGVLSNICTRPGRRPHLWKVSPLSASQSEFSLAQILLLYKHSDHPGFGL
jgi:hypothetical protein